MIINGLRITTKNITDTGFFVKTVEKASLQTIDTGHTTPEGISKPKFTKQVHLTANCARHFVLSLKKKRKALHRNSCRAFIFTLLL